MTLHKISFFHIKNERFLAMENQSPLDPHIMQRLDELGAKYNLTGQSLLDNLEGLLHSKYLKYWEYIHLDTLLSLQNPRTQFPDEMIFIVYHQITELYFKIIIWEIDQIAAAEEVKPAFLLERMQRINRYFKHLSHSFEIMIDGMDIEQFRQFRMALLPASGFQSAQFRMIEIMATDFIRLVDQERQNDFDALYNLDELFPHIYWKKGASDEQTQRETITSQYFQERYKTDFLGLAKSFRTKNLWQQYCKITENQTIKMPELEDAFRRFDHLINVEWRLAHLKAAAHYLKSENQVIEATGGTNWQKYLPPRFQRRIFYPTLWSIAELENWGKPV